MPNHCANRISITGPKEDRDAFLEAAKSDDEVFDIENIIPLPNELRGIHAGSVRIGRWTYRSWRDVQDPKNPGKTKHKGITKKEARYLTKKYGACNEYDWRCHRLGTKWGAYETELECHDDDETIITYRTAWGPLSQGAIKALAKEFPSLQFMAEYAEQGSGFYGFILARGDEVEEETDSTEGGWVEHEGKECDYCGSDCGHWDPKKIPERYIDLLNNSG